jgi:MoaA/NifB/PqqE/SkfB family radical SAM enzyme
MDPGLFQRIRRQVFPRASVVGLSCGAEPFCNPSIGEHLKSLWESGVPGRELVTNGTLLNRSNAALLVRYPPTTLFVSIDGARPETHAAIRGGADLNAVIANLRELVGQRGRRRFPVVALSTTLQKANLREIPDLVDLAADIGAGALGLAQLVPYMGLSTLESVVDLDSRETQDILGEAAGRAVKHGMALTLPDRSERVSGASCPYLDSTVYLAPDGAVFPCPYWNTGNPIGDLTLEDFDSVWSRRREHVTPETCADCPEVTCRSREVRKDR